MDGFFVSGTDTGVGKTVVSTGLIRSLRDQGHSVGCLKPVASGLEAIDGRLQSADVIALRAACGSTEPDEEICPFAYEPPLSPNVASRGTGRPVALEDIVSLFQVKASRYDRMVVEGVGGLAVPLRDDGVDVADLAKAIGLPLVVVARSGLGTLNHTLLTVDYARKKQLEIAAVILKDEHAGPFDPSVASNVEVLAERTQIPVLRCPWFIGLDAAGPDHDLFRSGPFAD